MIVAEFFAVDGVVGVFFGNLLAPGGFDLLIDFGDESVVRFGLGGEGLGLKSWERDVGGLADEGLGEFCIWGDVGHE